MIRKPKGIKYMKAHIPLRTLIPLAPFLVFFFFLSGCMPIGLPAMFVEVPALTYIGYGKNVIDVASIIGSEDNKSMSDHVISRMTGQDCAMLNLIRQQDICKEIDPHLNRFSHLVEG